MENHSPCRVFTPDWMAKQARKYASVPVHERPSLYRLWTAPECRQQRELIEHWVGILPPSARERLVPKLRMKEQFEHLRNELGVGDSLRRMGYNLDYEPELGGQTPDWLANHSGNAGKLLVEVVSSNAPPKRESINEMWDAFRRSFEELAGNDFLWIQPPFLTGGEGFVQPPSRRRRNVILQKVENWLRSAPSDGEELCLDGIVIRVAKAGAAKNHVSCGISLMPYHIDSFPLWESLRKKARKYKALVQKIQIPLVICVVADYASGRDFFDLDEVAFGKHVPDGRDKNSIFKRYPTVSALTMGVWNGLQMTHKVIRNSLADFPLEDQVFITA